MTSQLATRSKGLTTSIPNEDEVLHTIRRRTAVRHRRRRVGGATLLVGAVALGGVLTVWRPKNRELRIYDDGSIGSILQLTTLLAPVSTTAQSAEAESTTTIAQSPIETTLVSTTAPSAPPSATTVVVPPPVTRQTPPPPPPNPVTAPPPREPATSPTPAPTIALPTTPSTAQPTSTSTSTTTATTTAATTTTTIAPTTVPPQPIRKTRVTGGGSVTVESVGVDQLVVIDAAPALGYAVTVERASGTSVLVIFAGGESPTTYRISATFDGTRIPFTVVKEPSPPPTTVAGGG